MGSIDQIDQIIYFEPKSLPWNEHIDVVCNKVYRNDKLIRIFLLCIDTFIKRWHVH